MQRRSPFPVGIVALAALAAATGPTVANDASASLHATAAAGAMTHSDEVPFLAETSKAMDKMMAGMGVKPTGDVDADFSAMMIPHHQGAIDMAVTYLRHGKNEQLRRIAQEIIIDQQQEIAAMRLALDQALPPSIAAPTQPEAYSATMSGDAMQKSPGRQMQIR